MKPLLALLVCCGLPLLSHGQSPLSAPPVEIVKPENTPGAGPASSAPDSSPSKPDRREKRRDRRRQPSPAAEAVALPSLAALDVNKNGTVSLEEFVNFEVERARQRAPSSFVEMDRNHDGQLSSEELALSSSPSAATRPRRLPAGDRENRTGPGNPPHPPEGPDSPGKTPPGSEPGGGVVEIAPPPVKH